ncbi:MAG: hypothetical protein JSV05_01880 [Candidatus Bathyarchaeota archaeon]|nr:MAG: hypothetical protein JSV05_01880 [Candidatus Bathyarchaeota archaeon]
MCSNDTIRLIHNPQQKPENTEFQRLQELIEKRLDDEEYERGLKLCLTAIKRFPEKPTLTHSWTLDFLVSLGKKKEAITVLEHGLRHGAWWSPKLLKTGWKGLADQPKFQKILKVVRKRFDEETAIAKAELIVRTSEKYLREKASPLLLILHGAYSNNNNSQHTWMSSFKESSVLLAFLQSSQIMSSDHFVWDDEDKALREVKRALSILIGKYRINRSKVILGGVSRGAEVALLSLFSGNTQADGFIAVIPSVGAFTKRFIKTTHPLIRKDIVRGFIITGEKDPRHPNTKTVYKFLKEQGIACQFHSVPGAGHTIPEDFDLILKKAINFVLKE